MTVSVYTIIGEKITMRRTTKEEALKYLAKQGIDETYYFKVEVTE